MSSFLKVSLVLMVLVLVYKVVDGTLYDDTNTQP